MDGWMDGVFKLYSVIPGGSITLTCVWFALVRAEKLTKKGKYLSLSRWFISFSFTYTDFPVPVGPTNRAGLSRKTKKNQNNGTFGLW